MNYNFEIVEKCPLVLQFGKPTSDSKKHNCKGFEDGQWIGMTDKRCVNCSFLDKSYRI